jgi:hypothetical protein
MARLCAVHTCASLIATAWPRSSAHATVGVQAHRSSAPAIRANQYPGSFLSKGILPAGSRRPSMPDRPSSTTPAALNHCAFLS